MGAQCWREVANSLDSENLVALIKCLTRAERSFPEWGAGSVSPVIMLYRRLCLVDGNLASPLADWILAKTDNSYLPFGTMNQGAKSVDEYQWLSEQAFQRQKARQRAEAERHVSARKQKAANATHALYGAVKRGDVQAVKALLAKGADCNARDQMGISVSELAVRQGRQDVIELIRNCCEAVKAQVRT